MPVGFSKPEIVKSIDVTDNVQIPSVIFELPNQHPDYTQLLFPRIEAAATVTNPTLPKTSQVSPSAFAKAFEPNPLLFKAKEHNDVAKLFKTKDPIAEQISTTTTQPPPRPTTTTSTTPIPPPTSPTTTPFLSTTQQYQSIPLIDARRPAHGVPEPIDGLQPPHTYFKTYDDSTTEGPPIYYQWKWAVPAFVLEPPKLNDPATPAKGK